MNNDTKVRQGIYTLNNKNIIKLTLILIVLLSVGAYIYTVKSNTVSIGSVKNEKVTAQVKKFDKDYLKDNRAETLHDSLLLIEKYLDENKVRFHDTAAELLIKVGDEEPKISVAFYYTNNSRHQNIGFFILEFNYDTYKIEDIIHSGVVGLSKSEVNRYTKMKKGYINSADNDWESFQLQTKELFKYNNQAKDSADLLTILQGNLKEVSE